MHITKDKTTLPSTYPSTLQARKGHGSQQAPPSREPSSSEWEPEPQGSRSDSEPESQMSSSECKSAGSSDGEPEPQEARRKRQLDLAGYPEVEAELERMRDYYMREVNALRRGVPLAEETWRKVRIHILGECKCVHISVVLVSTFLYSNSYSYRQCCEDSIF